MSTSGELVRIDGGELDLSKGPVQSYGTSMFDVYCPCHQARILLGPRSIQALRNTPDGAVLHWRCRCGATGVEPFSAAQARVGRVRLAA